MFSVYLPIAEMSVDVMVVLLLGGITGVLSGMFGVGGGFLITPLLMFMGIPPAVAVASSANQIIAASASGFLTHWRRSNVDFRMGGVLLFGGLIGSAIGVWLFKRLQILGQIDLTISVVYVVFLGIIGGLMLLESIRTIIRQHRGHIVAQTPQNDSRMRRLLSHVPFHMHFPHSELTISALIPICIGIFVGIYFSGHGVKN